MATLRMCDAETDGATRPSVTLRKWLEGRWTILLSHPDDCVRCELELDRWLAIVAKAFRQARIVPLALSRRRCPIDRGWVSQVSGDDSVVSLFERINGWSLLDDQSCRLRSCLERVDQRFAMIVDSELCPRWTLLYGAADPSPSPLDLVRLACRLRSAETQIAQRAPDRAQNAPSMSARRGQAGYAWA